MSKWASKGGKGFLPLSNIGKDIAQTYGGELVDYMIDEKSKEVIFGIMEHGEEMNSSMTFDEIKKEYKFDIANVLEHGKSKTEIAF